MAAFHSPSTASIGMVLLLLIGFSMAAFAYGNFYHKFDVVWGDGRAVIQEAQAFPGNSAGTVTAYYLSSKGEAWDEIDFEFLGNLSGQPYILHTNVFCQGKGNREQQFYLWFDPTADFHTYSILWNPERIVFSVDGIPIREFKNLEFLGVPFPKNQKMRLYSTLWNADDWATRGGLVKTDWSQAPFKASYRNFNADACVWSSGSSYCSSNKNAWFWEELNFAKKGQMKWVQNNYMVYNYCEDTKRFPQGLPTECTFADIL
ncbi:hypothetical protein ES332_D05G006900v1 [Gossypium tomentosum]|uniref:Xyloglucan endotransglucosylase/hydrolase n=1 Tax=Gossypium tomentosum TaxID=34277 RepID=A0A5D2KPW9_GOSTO|nr:hypothetical protein ES332_D05G006900v1 [Gossypium tomentosum]